jgi:cytochrome c biogenesis protein CcmG/thiol:disulfide interchange protein DsbE
VVTLALVRLRAAIDRAQATDAPPIGLFQPVPEISGLTLDGEPFSLASLRGRPVIVNFWGPTCIPCRQEFPLLKSMLAAHAGEGLAVVGVLMDDPPAPARDFIALYGATWPTVDDPQRAIHDAYRVAARPVSYFIDRDGILQSIQVGAMEQRDFDRQYPAISRPAASGGPAGSGSAGGSPPAGASPAPTSPAAGP